MRRIKKGDVFKVKLENGEIRYFQYIGKDSSELNGDVICIFKKHYTDECNQESIIMSDEIECYIHTTVSSGMKWGLWEYAFSSPVKSEEGIFFRTSQDVGLFPRQIIVSHKWVVWEMNKERVFVGVLPKEYHSAEVGSIYSPEGVIKRLETGTLPMKFYPIY